MTTLFSKKIHYERLQNGVDLYALSTGAKDVVMCKMAFEGGVSATYAKQTLALLAGDMLPGGTGKKSKSNILDTFDAMGVRISVQFSKNYLIVSLASRNAVFLDALRLLVEVLTKPSFSLAEYTTAFSRVKNQIITLAEDEGVQSKITLMQSLYKKGHPHWEPSLIAMSKQLHLSKRREVVTFYKDTFSGVGAMVCVAGDIAPKKIHSELVSILSRVPSARPKKCEALHPEKNAVLKKVDKVVSLKDKYNVDTLLGMPLSITRDSDDYLPLWFGINILGASSTSRLFNTLRTKESLTYGAYAALEGTLAGNPGYIKCRAIFPNDVFLQGRDVLRRTVKEFVERGVTTREVRERKEEMVGKYKVGLSTTSGLCEYLFATLINQRPITEMDTFEERVNAIGLKAVNTAIHTHIDYELSVTAAAGSVRPDGKVQ